MAGSPGKNNRALRNLDGSSGEDMVTLLVATSADPASIGPASSLLAMPGWHPGPSLQVQSIFNHPFFSNFLSVIFFSLAFHLRYNSSGCCELYEQGSEAYKARQATRRREPSGQALGGSHRRDCRRRRLSQQTCRFF